MTFQPGTFMQIEPCPARGKWNDAYFTDPKWYFEAKIDGDRRLGQFIDGAVRFTGRRISDIDGLYVEKTNNVPHITRSAIPGTLNVLSDREYDFKADMALLQRVKILNGTILDGECIISQGQIDAIVASGEVVGGLSKKLTSFMGSLPGEAVRKQHERGFLRWIVFDCLAYKGKNIRALPQSERKAFALKAVQEWDNPYVTVIDSTSVNKKAFLENILAQPFGEGVIAKRVDAVYGDKKLWAKKKLVESYDCVVMGYEPPEEYSEKTSGEVSKTKFWLNGWIGAVKIGQYRDGKLWECGTISGMDEAIRIDFSKNGDKLLGRVVQVECNGREPTGKFRSPRFDGFRDDKKATDCVYYEEEC